MIVVLDARARVELINPKCLEVFGRAEHEVVGRDWFELAVPDHERSRTREAFDRLIAGEVEPGRVLREPDRDRAGPRADDRLAQRGRTRFEPDG